jgi:hypothetical protein
MKISTEIREIRVVSLPTAVFKVTEVTIPRSIQIKIADGLKLGPVAIANLYPPVIKPPKTS